MDSGKVACIQSWPQPTDIKSLRGFLGLTGYYRRFIHHYGLICKPLTNLLQKDNFFWNPEATAAFQQLKTAMCTAPVLRMLDFTQSFIIETDASNEGMGAVLMQQGQPISYLSKAFSSRNKVLSTYEKELMALVLAITKWRHYLIGQYFNIRTDHQSLKHLLE